MDAPPEHVKAREGLRVGGVLLAGAGGLCVLVAGIDFFSAFASFGSGPGGARQPKLFWLFFIGLPMLGVGLNMLKFGFLGAIAKYGVREGAPAAAEGINRVGMGASPGLRAAAGAFAAGTRDAAGGAACAQCGEVQDADAKFCDGCGSPMGARCAGCGAANEAGARFCDQCGAGLG